MNIDSLNVNSLASAVQSSEAQHLNNIKYQPIALEMTNKADDSDSYLSSTDKPGFV